LNPFKNLEAYQAFVVAFLQGISPFVVTQVSGIDRLRQNIFDALIGDRAFFVFWEQRLRL